ncbi:hypothetical protein, partial [Anaerococcus sp.]|uniref:hypothetical protein n=1 Tax=Anaerococcus sp. TaxID=1872515 RepID=UPI002A77DBCD|nr:hypothetical protein [Anaerococcus sp.]
ALGLGPVQTSQNYDFKLNNLAYAEEAGADGVTTEESQKNEADNAQTDNQDQAQTQNEGGDTSGEDKDDPLVEPEVQPGTDRNANSGGVGKSEEEIIKEALEAKDKAVRESEAFKLATEAERTGYEANYSEIEKKVLDSFKKDKKISIEKLKEELKGEFLTASRNLGYTVVKNLPKRMELRRLKAELEAASKEAKKEYSEDLKNLIKKTDDILASKEHTSEEIEENLSSLTKSVEAYKKDNSVDIDPAKLSAEEAKYGYPDDVYSETRGIDKDLSELRLDARVMLEDYVDDEKAQARIAELKKKVDANTASEAEKTEHANLTNYDLMRLALAQKMIDPDIDASTLLGSINAYKEAADKIVIEEKEDSELESKYEKLLKEYEEVKSSDIYKNASEEKKKAYDKALEDFKNKKYTILEELEAAKAKMEEAKNALSVKVTTEEEKEIESVIEKHGDFIKSDEYLRATAELQKAYDDAYDAIKADKTKENLDKVKKAKTDISDYYSKFNAEIESLEKYIDQAKSESLTEDSLKKIKKEYKEKLEEIKSDNSKTIDDIKELKEEFDAKLNPKEADPKKKTKKVVSTSKKSNGKVRTGVDAILPVVGGVAIVAAIGLIFTRRKNK